MIFLLPPLTLPLTLKESWEIMGRRELQNVKVKRKILLDLETLVPSPAPCLLRKTEGIVLSNRHHNAPAHISFPHLGTPSSIPRVPGSPWRL